MKTKSLVAILIIILIGIANNVDAQSVYAKKKAKEQKKEYKTKMKRYAKEGWQIFSSSHTLEVALLTHYEKKEQGDVVELSSNAVSSSKNIGKDKLIMSACASYAQLISSNLKGRIVEDWGSRLTTTETEEFEQFYAAFENNVKSEIRGELRPSYIVFRPTTINGKQVYEFEAYYLIDEAAASRARIRAFENAAKESAIAQKYAEQVSDFIKNGYGEE